VPEDLDDGELERRLFTQPTFDKTPARPLLDWNQGNRDLKRSAVTLLLLWYCAEHIDVTASRFRDLYRGWCKTISPTMRQPHGPASRLFVDFAGDTVPVLDIMTGVNWRAHIFVAVQMPSSSMLHADKGYDSNEIRRQVEGKSAMPSVPPKSHSTLKKLLFSVPLSQSQRH
jgi:transposase